jgi:type I restriction enzyme S subunit
MSFKETEIGLIPNDWELKKLMDAVVINMGQSPKSEFYNTTSEGVPFMQGRTTFGEKFHSIDTWCTDPKKFAQKNDVLMSVRAPVGDVNIATMDLCIGRGLCSLRMKNGNNEYLYYLLKNYINIIISKESGTVFGSINKTSIETLKLPFPSLKEQKAIAHILSTLDDKIEVNNQINKTLENIAQTIFKQWFVDFEFPNGAGEPYKSSGGEMVESELGMIPKGWEVTKLDEICNFISGYSYKGNELVASNNAMITIKNFDRNGGFKLDGYKEISISDRVKDKHFVSIFDILVAHTDLTQNAEIIGNPILVTNTMSYKKIIFSMDTVKVDPIIENYRFYIYGLLLDSNFKGYALGNMNGTTVLHLSKKALPDYKFVKASNDLIERYNYLVKPLYEKIINIYSENIALNKLRDSLLPKLMSGEIRVPIEEN